MLEVLRHFSDGTSPDVRGIPIGVWKLLPKLFFNAVSCYGCVPGRVGCFI